MVLGRRGLGMEEGAWAGGSFGVVEGPVAGSRAWDWEKGLGESRSQGLEHRRGLEKYLGLCVGPWAEKSVWGWEQGLAGRIVLARRRAQVWELGLGLREVPGLRTGLRNRSRAQG